MSHGALARLVARGFVWTERCVPGTVLHVVHVYWSWSTTTRRLLSFDARRGAVIVNGRGRTSGATILPRILLLARCRGEQDRDTQPLALRPETE